MLKNAKDNETFKVANCNKNNDQTKSNDTQPEKIRIEDFIHVVRGEQVMLDSDLARLYGVQTSQLNRQVKRNIDRFPEDFMFQLTKDETQNLMCQIGISSLRPQKANFNEDLESQIAFSSWGGTRKLPYVFTENGVAMLSSVLRSKTAIELNIRIMRAFNSMRRFLITNAQLFQRLETMEHTQLKIVDRVESLTSAVKANENRIDEVFERLDGNNAEPIEGFFFDGQIFDAYALISDLVRKAKQRVILIDNYVDDRVLRIMDKRADGVLATIYTSPKNSSIADDIAKHNAQYPMIELLRVSNVHDRFLIIDDNVYFIGGSIKDLGKKIVAFSEMAQSPQIILDNLR